jgi:hypothetical protein
MDAKISRKIYKIEVLIFQSLLGITKTSLLSLQIPDIVQNK